ncbi:MAG: hypothetical protein LLF90_12125 [Methanomicrobiaceae archaeon]|uniref:hypothetical protein n=1 Tax=Methanoculleus sp. TaxID=90427 RepID=UPI00320EA964|nr:hypothetical protein [Methanomicrobiaceae archaeon]
MPQTDIAEVVSFFNNEFIPAYSDLTGFIVNKPQEILIGIEYAFSHLMQHFNEELGTESQDKNLEKAYHHLQRATLDCYKLLWVYMNTNIVQLIDNQNKRKFCVNMVEGDLLLAYQRFRTKAQEARTIEGRNVGLDIMPSIAAYKGACIEGRKILVNIDEIKVNDLEKLETRAYRFITAKEFIVGLLTGLVSSLIIYAIQIYF